MFGVWGWGWGQSLKHHSLTILSPSSREPSSFCSPRLQVGAWVESLGSRVSKFFGLRVIPASMQPCCAGCCRVMVKAGLLCRRLAVLIVPVVPTCLHHVPVSLLLCTTLQSTLPPAVDSGVHKCIAICVFCFCRFLDVYYRPRASMTFSDP